MSEDQVYDTWGTWSSALNKPVGSCRQRETWGKILAKHSSSECCLLEENKSITSESLSDLPSDQRCAWFFTRHSNRTDRDLCYVECVLMLHSRCCGTCSTKSAVEAIAACWSVYGLIYSSQTILFIKFCRLDWQWLCDKMNISSDWIGGKFDPIESRFHHEISYLRLVLTFLKF